MAVSDSKSTIEKIEQVLSAKFVTGSNSKKPSKVIWSIHSDNSGSEENQHFINNISSAVKNVDALLASPSLCTGVDIQGNHFDEVYGFFNAVALTATDCLQALHRYRERVPLHIWVAPRPSFGYKDTLHRLLARMGYQITVVETDTDNQAFEQLKEAKNN